MAHAKCANGQEMVKKKDQKVVDLQRVIADIRKKMAKQKNLFEAVRTDRNLYTAQSYELNMCMLPRFEITQVYTPLSRTNIKT